MTARNGASRRQILKVAGVSSGAAIAAVVSGPRIAAPHARAKTPPQTQAAVEPPKAAPAEKPSESFLSDLAGQKLGPYTVRAVGEIDRGGIPGGGEEPFDAPLQVGALDLIAGEPLRGLLPGGEEQHGRARGHAELRGERRARVAQHLEEPHLPRELPRDRREPRREPLAALRLRAIEVERDRQEILLKASQRMQEVVKKLADEKGYDVVIDTSNTVHFKAALEITADATAAYDKAHPAK